MYQLKQDSSCNTCTADVAALCVKQLAKHIVTDLVSACTCLATSCQEEFVLVLVMLQFD